MALAMAALAGEVAWGFASTLIKLGDGSFIAVQTDKPSYHAGEMMTGKIVAQINSPVVCDEVSLKVRLKEKVEWDDETCRTVYEGEGESRTSKTVWDHHERQAKHTLFKQKIQVATLDHVLPPGMWQYPFSYQIPASVPGVVKVKRHEDARDPEWRSRGRKLEVKAQTIFSVKAVLETRGVFSRDLKSRQEMTVNPFFDWSRMAPQKVSKAGQVLLCCCIPRGTVTLNAIVDKAAYQSGETMRVSATIQNDSASNIDHMVSRLNRFITLSDGKGHTKRIHDDLCRAEFPGVGPKASATREMPLTLSNSSGPLLPSIKSPHISIEYRFDCECDIPWAPDIEAQMPVVIYQPAPATFGLAAAFGGAVPAGMAAFMPASPAGGYGSPVGAGAGAMPAPGGAMVVPNPAYH